MRILTREETGRGKRKTGDSWQNWERWHAKLKSWIEGITPVSASVISAEVLLNTNTTRAKKNQAFPRPEAIDYHIIIEITAE